MKLFKISFISIISIFFFQSQLYGINLLCKFKLKINERHINHITCSDTLKDVTDNKNVYDVCDTSISGKEIYGLDIDTKSKDVFVKMGHPNFMIEYWKKEGKKIPKEPKGRFYKVSNVLNHKKKLSGEYSGGENTYLITMEHRIFGIYTLYFDSSSKKSILVSYRSGKSREKKDISYSVTKFGKCFEY